MKRSEAVGGLDRWGFCCTCTYLFTVNPKKGHHSLPKWVVWTDGEKALLKLGQQVYQMELQLSDGCANATKRRTGKREYVEYCQVLICGLFDFAKCIKLGLPKETPDPQRNSWHLFPLHTLRH